MGITKYTKKVATSARCLGLRQNLCLIATTLALALVNATHCLGVVEAETKTEAEAEAEAEPITSYDKQNAKITISIHSGESWLGISSDNILSVCKINRDKMTIGAFKQTALEEKEIEILRRFVLIKEVLKHQKENKALSERQGDLVKNDMPQESNPQERLRKTTHMKIWVDDALRDVVLINDQKAREIWPEDIIYLLKLVSTIAKRAPTIACEGAGFTQSLDHYKNPTTKWKDWASLLRNDKPFQNVSDQDLSLCPKHIQQMISFPGYVVPLQKSDLKLMTKLNWTEIPEEDSFEGNSTQKVKETPFDVWWGIIEYKAKTYGINAWQSENSKSLPDSDTESEEE